MSYCRNFSFIFLPELLLNHQGYEFNHPPSSFNQSDDGYACKETHCTTNKGQLVKGTNPHFERYLRYNLSIEKEI